jgi:uncharacterized protein (TIGR02270 family)
MSLELFEEHLGEATFLWHQREHVLASPRHTPEDTAAHEARLLRHVDGLVLTGVSTVERRLLPVLEDGDPEAISVATLVLLDPDVRRPEPVLHALRQGEPEHRVAICQALRSRPYRELTVPLQRMLEDGPPTLQPLLLDVLSEWHGLPRPLMERFLVSGEPCTQAAALRAASRQPSPTLVPRILDGVSSKDPDVRQAAVIAGLIHEVAEAWSECRQQASRHEPESASARLLLACHGDAPERALLLETLARPEQEALRRQTLWALGFSGSRESAAACLPWMSSEDPLIARLAGEAFSAITGLRLAGALTLENHDEEPVDEALSLTESWLPRPRADAVADWWRQNHTRFSPGVRYLDGAPFSPERLLASFEAGAMRRRPPLALELKLRSRGTWAPPLQAFMAVQRRELEGFSRSGTPAPVPAPQLVPVMPGPRSPVITAMGMVSSLALGMVASCAAASAGLVHARELEGCEALDPSDGHSHPVRGHAIAGLTEGFGGLGRLARLGEAALGDLGSVLKQAGDTLRIGLYVALPGGAHEREHARRLTAEDALDDDDLPPPAPAAPSARVIEELVPLLARLTGFPIPREHQRAFPQDASGFLLALDAAHQALRQGQLDRCIVGGIDSLVEPSRLQALKTLGLLKVPGQPSRMLPGEAAALLVLERHGDARQRGAPVLALCEGIRAPACHGGAWSGAAKAGRTLAERITETLTSLVDEGRHTGRIIGGLNGHDRRAYAWGHALPILKPYVLGQLPLWSPAESFGELGAAAGPVAVCVAVRDFARGLTASPHSLVWLMDDEGNPGSFYVRAVHREHMSAGEHA